MNFFNFIRQQFTKPSSLQKVTDPRLQELEQTRMEWQSYAMELGDRWDYLDYSKPSAIEKKRAELKIKELTPKEAEAKTALNNLIDYYRVKDIAVLKEWSAMHVRICDLILSNPSDGSHNESVRISVVEKTKKDWLTMPENLEMDFYNKELLTIIPKIW